MGIPHGSGRLIWFIYHFYAGQIMQMRHLSELLYFQYKENYDNLLSIVAHFIRPGGCPSWRGDESSKSSSAGSCHCLNLAFPGELKNLTQAELQRKGRNTHVMRLWHGICWNVPHSSTTTGLVDGSIQELDITLHAKNGPKYRYSYHGYHKWTAEYSATTVAILPKTFYCYNTIQ